MATDEERLPQYRDVWPLHAVRYALMAAGVALWLYAAADSAAVAGTGGAAGAFGRFAFGGLSMLGPTPAAALAAAVPALLMAVELPLHGPGRRRGRPVWAALQAGLAVVTCGLAPGAGAVLFACAVVSGLALLAPWGWAAAAGGTMLAAQVAATRLGPVAAGQAGTVGGLAGGMGNLVGGAANLAGGAWLSAAALAGGVLVGRFYAERLAEAAAHRRTVAELEAAQGRLVELSERLGELAAANERRRLAEQLHDTLGHALVGVLLQVQVARQLVSGDPEAAAARLERIERSLRASLAEVRRALRTSRSGEIGEPALDAALERLASDFAAAGGPEVSLVMKPDAASVADVAPQIAELVLRTVQEALTNAVRHGRAGHVRVELEAAGPRLYLRIADDGVGAAEVTPGLGLAGMASRAQAAGGALRFETAAGQGFRIELGVRRR